MSLGFDISVVRVWFGVLTPDRQQKNLAFLFNMSTGNLDILGIIHDCKEIAAIYSFEFRYLIASVIHFELCCSITLASFQQNQES